MAMATDYVTVFDDGDDDDAADADVADVAEIIDDDADNDEQPVGDEPVEQIKVEFVPPAPARAIVRPPSSSHQRILELDIGADRVIEALQLKVYADEPGATPSRESLLLMDLNRQFLQGEEVNLPLAMKSAGLLLPEILELLHSREVALALAHSGGRVRSVLDGLGEAAEPKWAICDICQGDSVIVNEKAAPVGNPDEGEEPVYPTEECPNPECENGKVRRFGDLAAAKLFLGAHGIGPRGAEKSGTTVNVNAQAGVRIEQPDSRRPQQESITSRVQTLLEG